VKFQEDEHLTAVVAQQTWKKKDLHFLATRNGTGRRRRSMSFQTRGRAAIIPSISKGR